jgi:hypothetical protein
MTPTLQALVAEKAGITLREFLALNARDQLILLHWSNKPWSCDPGAGTSRYMDGFRAKQAGVPLHRYVIQQYQAHLAELAQDQAYKRWEQRREWCMEIRRNDPEAYALWLATKKKKKSATATGPKKRRGAVLTPEEARASSLASKRKWAKESRAKKRLERIALKG